MADPILRRATVAITIRAAPEKVFDAWLDPRLAARFLAAGDMTVGELALDPREGGEFRLVMRREGQSIAHSGRYVLIDRPRRLVFTWISPGTDLRLSLVSLTFTAIEGGVRIDLEHEGLPGDELALRHRRGWSSILDKLEGLLTTKP